MNKYWLLFLIIEMSVGFFEKKKGNILPVSNKLNTVTNYIEPTANKSDYYIEMNSNDYGYITADLEKGCYYDFTEEMCTKARSATYYQFDKKKRKKRIDAPEISWESNKCTYSNKNRKKSCTVSNKCRLCVYKLRKFYEGIKSCTGSNEITKEKICSGPAVQKVFPDAIFKEKSCFSNDDKPICYFDIRKNTINYKEPSYLYVQENGDSYFKSKKFTDEERTTFEHNLAKWLNGDVELMEKMLNGVKGKNRNKEYEKLFSLPRKVKNVKHLFIDRTRKFIDTLVTLEFKDGQEEKFWPSDWKISPCDCKERKNDLPCCKERKNDLLKKFFADGKDRDCRLFFGYQGADIGIISKILDNRGNTREVGAYTQCMFDVRSDERVLTDIFLNLKQNKNLLEQFGKTKRYPEGVLDIPFVVQRAEEVEVSRQLEKVLFDEEWKQWYQQTITNMVVPPLNNWSMFKKSTKFGSCALWDKMSVKYKAPSDSRIKKNYFEHWERDIPTWCPPLSAGEKTYLGIEYGYVEGKSAPKIYAGSDIFGVLKKKIFKNITQSKPQIGEYLKCKNKELDGYKKTVDKLGYRSVAGPSPSTAKYLEWAKLLKFNDAELAELRLFVLAYFLQVDAHSFIEIMLGANPLMADKDKIFNSKETDSCRWPLCKIIGNKDVVNDFGKIVGRLDNGK